MKKVFLAVLFAAVGLGACSNGDVVAKVGGSKITEASLNEKLAQTPPNYQEYVNTPVGRKQFIDAVVRERIVIEAAKDAGVAKKDEYKNAVKAFEAEQKRQFEEYKNGLLIQAYVPELQASITATDADIKAYYDANKALFDKPVEYTVKHILVPTREQAESAFARLQSGESFDKVAKEVSQDAASASKGGLIGPFKRGALVKEFEVAALNLKKGELSGIVETSYGYHIIYKVSEKTLPGVSFEKAAAEIKGIIEKERFDQWFADENKKLNVKVNYDLPSNK
ncbi:foldase protein PrsA [Endomicrobium proavitum]|uniref:peptidylprolyl isomerase n=1 Tax=Endomicrobium proavitum TaxID=1408281 RepID=A0A0G3WM80_9BACT|nr:peptidylprolyl isomerase [Endomicrobium proavitum]AKL98584.1 putative Foldase protein PrsA [Endomicrobium proavitum]